MFGHKLLLSKIGVVSSPACSLCGEMSESFEHFFISCLYSKNFWAEVIKWLDNLGVKIGQFSDKDLLFGILKCEDEYICCLLYTSPSPRDLSTSRMPSSA